MTFHDLYQLDLVIERDIRYRSGDDVRHRLDVYAPHGAAGLPVVLFFYGGGWRSGDKRLFEHLGRAFVARGIIAVTVNYRLSPAVKSPEHARDCADALLWASRNIAGFGGDPARIFLSGHSAGGHLAALITTDQRYLQAVGLPAASIRGTVLISGATDLRIHSETTVYTRREHIEEAFGSGAEQLAAASPMEYVRAGLPPFLIIVAERDPPGLREQGRRFVERLRDAGGDALYMSVKGRDHYSIVRRFGPSDDATCSAMVDFIKHYAGMPTDPGTQ